MARPRLVAVQRADHVVVGAGLLGLAAARELHQRGREVIVLDQAEIGGPAAGSKGSSRVFRLGYDDPGWVRLAMQALRTDVGAMAVDLASRVVGESLADVARQRRIVERFIEGLEQPAADQATPDADQARSAT